MADREREVTVMSEDFGRPQEARARKGREARFSTRSFRNIRARLLSDLFALSPSSLSEKESLRSRFFGPFFAGDRRRPRAERRDRRRDWCVERLLAERDRFLSPGCRRCERRCWCDREWRLSLGLQCLLCGRLCGGGRIARLGPIIRD